MTAPSFAKGSNHAISYVAKTADGTTVNYPIAFSVGNPQNQVILTVNGYSLNALAVGPDTLTGTVTSPDGSKVSTAVPFTVFDPNPPAVTLDITIA